MDAISLILGYVLVAVVMSYGFGMLFGGEAKANALLKWEWRQVKLLFKWFVGLFVKFFQMIHRNIKP